MHGTSESHGSAKRLPTKQMRCVAGSHGHTATFRFKAVSGSAARVVVSGAQRSPEPPEESQQEAIEW
eukprot:scaffold7572_cov55-Phaeocystis_antarctica.AAC.3